VSSQLIADTKIQFKFLHDKVQQAAYALIENNQKQAVHLKIGRLLLNNTPDEELDEKIFDIVGHFNQSIDVIQLPLERLEVAKLNLQAGQKAKKATAYEAAVNYLNIGRECLEQDSWQKQYELTFELHKQCAECEFLLLNIEQSEKLFSIAIDNARSALEKAEIHVLQMKHSMGMSKLNEAFTRGREGLRLCDIDFPVLEKMQAAIQKQSEQLSILMANKPIDTLLDTPQMHDKKKILGMRILSNIALGGYLSGDTPAFTVSTLMSTRLSLLHGQLDLSASIYGWYGVLLSTQGKLKESYQFGQLALELAEKYPTSLEKTQTHNLVGTFLTLLDQHLKYATPVLMKGYHSGLEVGDVLPAIFCYGNLGMLRFASGEPLDDVLEHINRTIQISYQQKVYSSGDIAVGYKQLLEYLQTGEARHSIEDKSFDTQQLQRINSSNSIAFIMHLRLQKAFWFNDYATALDTAKKAEAFLTMIPGYFLGYEHYFIYPLILTALYANASEQDKKAYLSSIEKCEQKMAMWAENCPANFLHRYQLIQAEKLRIIDKPWQAMQSYDQAIKSAKNEDFLQIAALANERAAEFWLCNDKADFANSYLKEAHYLYAKWGAKAKVMDLEKKYPQLKETTQSITPQVSISETIVNDGETQIRASSLFDVNSVIKASQTLSREIYLNQLLASMMQIVVENAGAGRGLLLLPQQQNWFIEAECHADNNQVAVLQSIAIEENQQVPANIIHYVSRTRENVVLSHASVQGNFIQDSYILEKQSKSVLAMPLLNQNRLTGILYLENDLTEGAFTPERLEILNLLSSQMAISIENSLLYNNLEKIVTERTSELKKSLERLNKTQKHLVESEKMASLGRLVAGIAHELNTPIGICVTASSYLLREINHIHKAFIDGSLEKNDFVEFVESSSQSTEIIASNLERASTLIKNFKLVTVDVSSEMPRSFNLHGYIQTIVKTLGPEIKKTKHNIEIQGDSELNIESYPGTLSQIMTNLIINSIKHAYKKDETGRIVINTGTNNSQVIIKFSDDGKGMTAETSSQIFDPFFTTRRDLGGSGLGLFILYNLVTQTLGGKVSCTSVIGTGTTFTISFPLKLIEK